MCWDCGKVSRDAPQQLIYYHYDLDDASASYFNGNRRINSGVQMPTKRRYYQSRIHFSTHLKNYLGLGVSSDAIDSKLINDIAKEVDLTDKNAYFEVREYLKKRKLSKHYKNIFHIIYTVCDNKPCLNPAQMQKLEKYIMAMQTYFYSIRDTIGRRSMPCIPWLLVSVVLFQTLG